MEGYSSVYKFVYSVFRFFALILCISEISCALDDDNMLTINVAAEHNSDIQNWNYSPGNLKCILF